MEFQKLIEDDEALTQDEPVSLIWFALGHVMVLAYLAVRVLLHLTPSRQELIWGGAIGLTCLMLAYAAFVARRPKPKTKAAPARVANPQ